MAASRTALVIVLAFLASCFSRPAMMTHETFGEIGTGDSFTAVEKKAGEPFSVKNRKDGSVEYQYIERVWMGDELVYLNRYYIVVKNGMVISKRFKQQKQPAYNLIYEEDPNDDNLL